VYEGPVVAEIIAKRVEELSFDWRPSEEDGNFPRWVMDEVKREYNGKYYAHPPYTDLAIELLDALGMWPWEPAKGGSTGSEGV